MSQKKILIFTATYNEASNIAKLIFKIRKYTSKASILIIDDNSPDGTGRKVHELKDKVKKLFLYQEKKN